MSLRKRIAEILKESGSRKCMISKNLRRLYRGKRLGTRTKSSVEGQEVGAPESS